MSKRGGTQCPSGGARRRGDEGQPVGAHAGSREGGEAPLTAGALLPCALRATVCGAVGQASTVQLPPAGPKRDTSSCFTPQKACYFPVSRY